MTYGRVPSGNHCYKPLQVKLLPESRIMLVHNGLYRRFFLLDPLFAPLRYTGRPQAMAYGFEFRICRFARTGRG